jgi:hypothetical protein
MDVVKRDCELCLQLEEGKSHAAYVAPELLLDEIAHRLQPAVEFIYLKASALQLKLSRKNKVNFALF